MKNCIVVMTNAQIERGDCDMPKEEEKEEEVIIVRR